VGKEDSLCLFAGEEIRARSRTSSPATEASTSLTDLPRRKNDRRRHPRTSIMRDEKMIRQRLEQLRGQLNQWGTPDLMVFVTTKDELRGWIRALEWVLGKS